MSACNGTINPNRRSHNQFRQSGFGSAIVDFGDGAINPLSCSSSTSRESRWSSDPISPSNGALSSGPSISFSRPSPLTRSGSVNVEGSKRVVRAARKVPKKEIGTKNTKPILWTKLTIEVMNKAMYQITRSSQVTTRSASSGLCWIAGRRR